MDRVRFGRALGFGARQAVRSLVTAVDAAASDSPSRKGSGVSGGSTSATNGAPVAPKARVTSAVRPVGRAVEQALEAHKGVRRGSRRFGEAIWRPFVRLSGVLWLEVSGVFFGIFALMALGYLWKLRHAWSAAATDAASHRSFIGAVVMLALFGYFSISSFARARQRERRR